MSAAMSGVRADVRFGGIAHATTRSDWLTPPALKRAIFERWDLGFDPCPYPRPSWSGLRVLWGRRAFVNPPYGRETSRWLAKGIDEIASERCEIAVYLLHARTDARWFHEYVLPFARELWFIRGRVAFRLPGTSKAHPSAFPSLLAVFAARAEPGPGPRVFSWSGDDPSPSVAARLESWGGDE